MQVSTTQAEGGCLCHAKGKVAALLGAESGAGARGRLLSAAGVCFRTLSAIAPDSDWPPMGRFSWLAPHDPGRLLVLLWLIGVLGRQDALAERRLRVLCLGPQRTPSIDCGRWERPRFV